MLPQAFQPFLEQRPICVMAQAVLENLFAPFHESATAGTARDGGGTAGVGVQ